MKTTFSVRSLLLGIAVVFTTFPVLLFGVFEVFEELSEGNLRAVEMSRRTANLIEREIKGSLDQHKALMEGIALEIDLKTLRPHDPQKIKKLLAEYPKLMGIIVIDSNAVSVASYSVAIDIPVGFNYGDRPQTVEARRTRRTTISGNLMGRATNVAAVVILVPLLNENGEVGGFLSGGVTPDKLTDSYSLGPDEYALVTDSFGGIVVSNPGQTSLTVAQLDSMAPALMKVTDGAQELKLGDRALDVQVVSIEPLGWKVLVGMAPEFLTARSNEAIQRTAVLALLCALIGVVIMSAVSWVAARGINDVGQQLERMSAVDLRPIPVSKTWFFPSELWRLIADFNQLLSRTAKAKLAELEAISRVGDSILIASADGTITYINEAGIRTLGDVTRRNLKDFVDKQAIDTIFLTGTPREWKGDVSIHKLDGSSFDGFLSTTPILDNDQVNSIVAIIHDITKEKAARESLIQSERMITLGELVAGTSHELNNPLAIVTGYADLLVEDSSLSAGQRTKIESIRKNALRASTVVLSLLAFARKRKPERVRTDVNAVVEAAAELKNYDLKTSGIQFEKRLGAALSPVFADPNQLQQVLLNVINNAQDAVLESADPRIILRTESLGEMVMITIEDNGPGIARADVKKVFDPFFTTKPVGKGTGLGLSISYGIVREHGGDIAVQSEPGQGTQVFITLPMDRTLANPVDRPSATTLPARPMRILVVDDERDIVSILRAGLSRPGVVVDSACSAADALSLAATITYDFVLTDVKMPGGSGIDLYKQLCGLDSRYSHRTIFLTGHTSNPTTVQFLEQEGLTYFAKPFDFQAIERQLRQMAEPDSKI